MLPDKLGWFPVYRHSPLPLVLSSPDEGRGDSFLYWNDLVILLERHVLREQQRQTIFVVIVVVVFYFSVQTQERLLPAVISAEERVPTIPAYVPSPWPFKSEDVRNYSDFFQLLSVILHCCLWEKSSCGILCTKPKLGHDWCVWRLME